MCIMFVQMQQSTMKSKESCFFLLADDEDWSMTRPNPLQSTGDEAAIICK
jgi:hypothetical protein